MKRNRVAAILLVLLAALPVVSSAQSDEVVYQPAILVGQPGSRESLTLSPDIWRTYPTAVHDSGRVLLLSDNPEYVSEPGIMYRDTVDGKARLYLYHATRGSVPLRYGIVLRNHTDRDVQVIITRKGLGGPSTAYASLGQQVLERFWQQVIDERLVVAPGEQKHLDPDIIYLTAINNALVHGIYDIETDGPLEVAFVADNDYFRFEKPGLDAYDDMRRPAGERMRGTFPSSERYITFQVGDRSRSLYLAGNFPPDLYVWGVDGVDGTPRQNYGNYGVTYHLDVQMNVTEPKRIRLYLGPAFSNAGSCSLASTVLLTQGDHDDNAEQGQVVRLPSSKQAIDVGLIGETVVLPGEPRVVRLDFNPPGGSCLPALLFAQVEAITSEEAEEWYEVHGMSDEPDVAQGAVGEVSDAALPEGVLFLDEFTHKGSDWEFTENPAFYEDGMLVVPTFGFTNGFAGDRTWHNYAVEARFRIDELGQYGGMRLFVRNQVMWVGYSVLFAPTGTYIDRVEGAWNAGPRLAVLSFPDARVRQGAWHTVRVEVVGSEISVWKDDVFLGRVVDDANMYRQGNIGFRTENSKITIDYIRVTEL